MLKKVLISLLVLILIVSCIAVTIVVMKKLGNNLNNTNIYDDTAKTYKTYFLYDPNKYPEILIYKTLDLKNSLSVTDKARQIFDLLTQGYNGSSAIPKGTKILDVAVDGEMLTLDLSREFVDNHPGGTFGERITVDTIVNSITEIEGINKVMFKINGKVEGAYIHITFDKPFSRNLSSYVIISETQKEVAVLNELLFTDSKYKLVYEGGPVHWGSRTVEVGSVTGMNVNRKLTLNITDESDLKGEDPKKTWTETWEVKDDGLYIDGFLAIKLPLIVGQEWTINGYKPIMLKDKLYNARIKITKIEQVKNEQSENVTQITTELFIDEVKTIDGKTYYERQTYETGIGYRNRVTTEPSIADIEMTYWLWKKVEK